METPEMGNNNLLLEKQENLLRKYLTIIKTFEHLQTPENKELGVGIDFHAVIINGTESMRIYRTKSRENDITEIVSDSIKDNAYGMGEEFFIRYNVIKNEDGTIDARVKDMSGSSPQNIPNIVEKLETIVRQKGTTITFMPGDEFKFDGQSWNKSLRK